MDRLPPGRLVDEVTLPVERGKVREFVRATGASDPVHVDADAAAAAGFEAIPAPLTFSVSTAHLRDQQTFVRGLGLVLERIVVGSVSWEYRRPILVGDELRAVRRVESDESRAGRSGPMRFVTLATEFTDQRGELVLVQREVLIERGISS
jgi:acyl dehydratase